MEANGEASQEAIFRARPLLAFVAFTKSPYLWAKAPLKGSWTQ